MSFSEVFVQPDLFFELEDFDQEDFFDQDPFLELKLEVFHERELFDLFEPEDLLDQDLLDLLYQPA